MTDLDALCGQLMALQRDRILAIQMQSRLDRGVEAYIRTRLGFTTTQTSEAERKRLSKLAREIKSSVEQGTGQVWFDDESTPAIANACSAVILRNMVTRGQWDDMRAEVEKRMKDLAKQTPGYAFVQRTRGFSELGLAVILGEAGNLSNYPKKTHLWKRLGLAVIDGRRQGNPGPSAKAEEWIAHGYVARRRAEVYAFVDDVLLRSQRRNGEDVGPYGAAYSRKKAEYVGRFAAFKHADNAARRYMAKMLIRDLWNAWRESMCILSKDHAAPDSRRAA